MFKIGKKVLERFNGTLKTFQGVATLHKQRDVSEADTVTLIKDILADTFGYNKYTELTSEQQIRGTFCDLAIKLDNKIKVLIEVKSAAIDLNEGHLRQAINYGANEGIEWIVLTNSIDWRMYRIQFTQPINYEEVARFNLLELNPKNEDDQQKLFLLCREGLDVSAMEAFHVETQTVNRFTIGQLMLSENVVKATQKEFRRLFPGIKIETQKISDILFNEVLKREVVEGDKAKEVAQKIKKINSKLSRASTKNDQPSDKSPPSNNATASITE